MAVAIPPVTRSRSVQKRRQTLVAYAFLFPTLLIFLVFRHGPAVASLLLGFFNWTIVDTPEFVGLNNYDRMIHDDIFWRSLKNTGLFVLMTVPTDVVLALFLAVLVNQRLRGMWLFRLAFFMPFVTATAIVAIVWRWIYQPQGIANGALEFFGLDPLTWLSDPDWALPAVAIMSVWKHVGFNMLILVAGLQAIPQDYEEAARLDGAGPLSIFFGITLPLLRPVLVLVTILTTIGSFQVFDAAYVMTNGGPFYATTTVVYYIYQNAFGQYQMGYAAAIAFALFMIVLVLTVLQRRFLGGGDDVY